MMSLFHHWRWYTSTGPSGFWIKQRGPFMWWGRADKQKQIALTVTKIREEDQELLDELANS